MAPKILPGKFHPGPVRPVQHQLHRFQSKRHKSPAAGRGGIGMNFPTQMLFGHASPFAVTKTIYLVHEGLLNYLRCVRALLLRDPKSFSLVDTGAQAISVIDPYQSFTLL